MTTRILGDTHLGKRFKNGVPLHRRGDREAMQWAQFEAHLTDVEPGDLHIQMGDLFDEAIVPYGVIYRAAQAYRRAAKANPHVVYAVLRGNHDASRDVEKITAFKLFSEMVQGVIAVVADEPETMIFHGHKTVLIPWDPVLNAGEVICKYEAVIRDAAVVYGHWDVVAIGETPNLLPAGTLKALGVGRAVTGHDHNRRELVMDGLPVTVTGSMQPYSHGEDQAGDLYITDDLATVLAADPDAYHDYCLRVRLAHDEVLDVEIDCLQLTLVREGKDDEDVTIDVEFEPFDFNALFALAVDQVGLSPALVEVVNTKLQESRMGESEG